MIIKLSLTLSSNHLQNLALPHSHQPSCPLSVFSDWVTGNSSLCIVYIIPQHSTLLAYSNLNGPLLLPSLMPCESDFLQPYLENVQRTWLFHFSWKHVPWMHYSRREEILSDICFCSAWNNIICVASILCCHMCSLTQSIPLMIFYICTRSIFNLCSRSDVRPTSSNFSS